MQRNAGASSRVSRRYLLATAGALGAAAASMVDDGVTADDVSSPFLNRFPYLGTPYSGF